MCTLPQDENIFSIGSAGGVGEVFFSGSEVTSIGEGEEGSVLNDNVESGLEQKQHQLTVKLLQQLNNL